jgi:hypothetical protein
VKPRFPPPPALSEVLNKYGFEDAAQRCERVYDLPEVLRSWENYPRSMDVFPTRLSRKPVTGRLWT